MAQILALALVGIVVGLVLGAAATYLAAGLLGDALGWRAELGIYPLPLAIAAAFGVLTAITFSLWPLARARSIAAASRSEEHTSELQSLMRISYAVFCLKKKQTTLRQ